MWLYELRDKLWNIIRWQVQHEAWWSRCSAQVLYGAAQKCAEGIRVLGYHVGEPPPNREAQFYKEWIRDATNPALDALSRYAIPDGSITKAFVPYEDAARRIKDCAVATANLPADLAVVYPAES